MEIKAFFGLLASAFILIGSIPYLVDIHHKSAKPHILSWFGWSLITALGALAMLAEGSTWSSAILWANTLMCLVIAVYAATKKAGVWSTTVYDYVLFGLGIIGLVLWQTLDMPILALICAIIADLFFGLPTIIKTYHDPSSETRLVWMFSTLSGLSGLFAIGILAFYDAAYPIYLFLYDFTMLLLVTRILKKSITKKASAIAPRVINE